MPGPTEDPGRQRRRKRETKQSLFTIEMFSIIAGLKNKRTPLIIYIKG